MTQDRHNPPAFPVSTIDGFTQEGMTLRDWFAGQALVGIVQRGEKPSSNQAWRAYEIANAMLAQREKDMTAKADVRQPPLPPRTFEWDLREAPTPRERIKKILIDANASHEWTEYVVRDLCAVLDDVAQKEHARGERDSASRSRNRPGDGDMGG